MLFLASRVRVAFHLSLDVAELCPHVRGGRLLLGVSELPLLRLRLRVRQLNDELQVTGNAQRGWGVLHLRGRG